MHRTLILTFILAVVTYLIYEFCSSKEFSFILTLASGLQCYGFGIVYIATRRYKSYFGLSSHTFTCFALALLSRLLSILIYEGYLPSDASGDYIYKIFEILSASFCILSLLQIHQQEESVKWYYFAPIMLILAIFIHPCLNASPPLDIAWTFALYMESIAILPQIHLFIKTGAVVESHISTLIVTQFTSKIISVIFWYYSYTELNESIHEGTISPFPGISGYFVMIAQIISIVMTIDFVYRYLESLTKGVPLVLLPS